MVKELDMIVKELKADPVAQRQFIIANLNRLAPIRTAKPPWWYEYGNYAGRHDPYRPMLEQKIVWVCGGIGKRTACLACWQTKLNEYVSLS